MPSLKRKSPRRSRSPMRMSRPVRRSKSPKRSKSPRRRKSPMRSKSPRRRKSPMRRKSPRVCYKLRKDNCKDVAACRWVVSHVKKGLKHKSKVLSTVKRHELLNLPVVLVECPDK